VHSWSTAWPIAPDKAVPFASTFASIPGTGEALVSRQFLLILPLTRLNSTRLSENLECCQFPTQKPMLQRILQQLTLHGRDRWFPG
jgi:hypothetical protein